MNRWHASVDFLVVGSGAAGMTAAIRSSDLGGTTLVVEKAPLYGGSTALSGGVLWVPNNPLMAAHGIADTPDDALAYLDTITAGSAPAETLRAYVNAAPRMLATLAERSHVRFECLPSYPDYYPEARGGKPGGRSCEPAVLDGLRLGGELEHMRAMPAERQILGGRVAVQAADGHMLLTGGIPAAWFMLRRLGSYYANIRARRRGRRNTQLTLGAALAGRLRLSLMDRGVPLWRGAPLRELITEEGRVAGAVVERAGSRVRIRAERGVLLAAGGFERNASMRRQHQPHPTGDDWTAGCESNTGDAVPLGVAAGASLALMDDAWWCPCMLAPFPRDARVWIMIFEKNLPGGIVVDARGKRFMNEAAPYNDVVKHMYRANRPAAPAIPAFFVFDAAYRQKYPCGPIMPSSATPDFLLRKSLHRAFFEKDATLEGLACKIGVDPAGLSATVEQFNRCAAAGTDLEFGRGASLQDRYYTARAGRYRNPCLGPIARPPFYAVQVYPGDLGTKGGFRIDASARVLGQAGEPIPGLYAAGNCAAAVMGRSYPGAGGTIGPAMAFGFLAAEHALGAGHTG